MNPPSTNNNSFLDDLNIFDSQQFFRFGKQSKHSSTCAKICTLIFVIILAAFLTLGLVGFFDGTEQQKNNSTTYVGSSSAVRVLADGQSFMMALEISKFQTSQTLSSNVVTSIVQVENGSVVGSPIATEKCTAKHFESISGINTIYSNKGMQNWGCLPLNTALQIDIEKHQFTGIKIILICTNCSSSTIIKSTVHLLTPVNFQSQSNTITYGINSKNYVLLQNNAKSYLSVDLSEYTIQNGEGYSASGMALEQHSSREKVYSSSTALASAEINIQKSTLKTTYSTTQVSASGFNSFAFFGGLIILLLLFIGALCVMRSFSQSSFDMAAASKIYQEKDSENYHIGSFFAQGINKILRKIGLEPKMQKSTYYDNLEHKMSCLRDVAYLESRINLLQNALTILLDSHQLAALRLANQPSLNQAYERYQQYQLKSSVLEYFKIKGKSTDISSVILSSGQSQQPRGTSTELKKNNSKAQVHNMRIEHNLETEAHFSEEVEERYTKQIREYLEKTHWTSEYVEAYNYQLLQEIVRRARDELQVLRWEMEESNNSQRSRKVFGVLIQSDSRFVELFMRMPLKKQVQGLEIVIYPSRWESKPSTMTTLP